MHVSVVMAVYNAAATVARAVDSIRRQTYADWDFIIVDDGSGDQTARIVEQEAAGDARIKVFRNQSNRGLAASLNIGWRLSRGELVARMDGDDVSLPQRFEKQVDFLTRHPEIDVLGAAKLAVDESGAVVGYGYRPESHEAIAAGIYRINPFVHPSVMMRRRFLEAMGGYDEDIRLLRAEDCDLWLRGYQQFRYHNLQEPLIRYRTHTRPSVQAIRGSAFAKLQAGRRDGRLLAGSWYALRTVVTGALAIANLHRYRYRSARSTGITPAAAGGSQEI